MSSTKQNITNLNNDEAIVDNDNNIINQNKEGFDNMDNNVHFEDDKLNNIFNGLDEKLKKEILTYPKNIQITLLNDINNDDLNQLYESLSSSEKKKIENLKIKDKFLLLKHLLNKKKSKEVKEQKEEIVKNNNKIAIIVPFRDLDKNKERTKQLEQLEKYMETYLNGYEYKIFVIEQSDDNLKFNRGKLLNIGFQIAETQKFNNFIFHDVDLLPSEDLKEYYINPPTDKPVHIASVWNRYGDNPNYFGGIVAFNSEMFNEINGYPNNFWGWGGEDDELLKRTKKFYNILKPTKGKITDLENLNLQDKLNYLKENELKFMKKKEALAQHETTWKENGLNELIYTITNTSKCGLNCIMYNVVLSDADTEDIENVDLYDDDNEKKVDDNTNENKLSPPEQFNKLIKLFYDLFLYRRIPGTPNHELEIRFGTKELYGIKKFTKNDYDNVVKTLKSFGFKTSNPSGTPSLRIRSEFLDKISGKFKMSNVRAEIDGIVGVETYCKSNDIKVVYKDTKSSIVNFVQKKSFINPDTKTLVRPVNMNDFNFRISLQTEMPVKKGIENFILENWRKSKKEFRYLNRVTFVHDDYPVKVDLSITKFGNKRKDNYGRSIIVPVNTIEESNIFNNPENYEIEIEVDNKKIGIGTKYETATTLLTDLRKVIKIILSGIQGTMYPISYPEQQSIMQEYMKLIWDDEYDSSKKITSKNFIGPNSITLQMTNISEIDDNYNVPNIRENFVVTEKADGDRHLMFISNNGKIYFINTNMDIKFSGAKTNAEECFNTILDGELISHDKHGNFINLYAAFDIYYYNKTDVRNLTFILKNTEKNKLQSRLQLLENFQQKFNPISILSNIKNDIKKYANDTNEPNSSGSQTLCPVRFETKKFYPISSDQTIFEGCKSILEKEKQGLFEYETDGLIFSHALYGVGTNVEGKAGPKTKITWEYSFKWKPPQFNTIDFLVTTLKNPNGDDVVKTIYEDGISMSNDTQLSQYKVIELRCGFNEKYDGFINPCQDIIDDNLPEYKPRFEENDNNDYIPVRFYPTQPYDVNAGLCNIFLNLDDNGSSQMFAKNGEVITDNTIVEFAYNLDAEQGWNWEPLRVRHDKTAKLRRGEKEYGNSYKTCNENWKSIHPNGRITEDMLITGLNIPEINISEDIYYNTPSGKMKTESMKNFHNLYVKKLIITGTSKQGDTLIDFACGKAGDLPKWISAKLSFVFGIDYSCDNLENRLDGACSRYLKAKKMNKHVPNALFVCGNSSLNIRDGVAMMNDKAKQITSAVFGIGTKDSDKIGKGVSKLYGKGENGFNVSSCQFALHYFFKNPDTLRGFLKNVAECTKLNGYFIGTAYDGKLIFNKLKKIKTGENVKLVDGDKKIWEIVKLYGSDIFEDNSSSIGYEISVYQESINQYINEYLINYNYLNRIMELYGFKLIDKEEATEMGLPEGSGLFSELFINMLEEIKKNKYKATLYGDAPNMSNIEKSISFLNRYFVYKKVREVNIDKIQIDLGEYEESVIEREKTQTQQAITVARTENVRLKPKIRKLSKKLVLINATEALDDPNNETQIKLIEKEIKKPKKNNTKKKKLVLDDSDDV